MHDLASNTTLPSTLCVYKCVNATTLYFINLKFKMLSPRIPHIDLLRGIAIFFVVLGHINSTPSVVEFIYGFHIPLFFFISGILFQPQRFENTRRFVLSRFKALGLPYLVLAFLTLLYWIVVERAVRAPEIPIWTQFLGILYGSFHLRYLAFNIVLWFIPCLLSTEILYWYLQRYIPTLWYGVLFILFATLIFLFPEKAALLPWGIGQAGIAISFYALGHQTRHFWIKKPQKKISIGLLATLPLLLLLQPFSQANLGGMSFPFPWAYFPIALCGIFSTSLIALYWRQNRFMEYFGKNSLVIMAFHGPVYRILLFLIARYSPLSTIEIRGNLLFSILLTLLCIALLIPFITLWNRYYPRLALLFSHSSSSR